jgi:hypothetical protein
MSEKKRIKVIKKEQRHRQERPASKTNPARETAREMVQNVTNWVNELRQKRHTEAADAVKLLVTETPQTSEI